MQFSHLVIGFYRKERTMKIWRVKVNDRENKNYTRTYWGVAKDYEKAGIAALLLAAKDSFNVPWVDEIVCYGDKSF